MTDRMEVSDMGRKKKISDQRRLYTERMRLQKGVFSSLANAAGHIGELYADFVQSDEVRNSMLLQKKADTIHLIMVKPVPGKERLYTILGEDGIYNEKKLAEFQQKHSVVTTIILNIPRLPEEGVLNAEKK